MAGIYSRTKYDLCDIDNIVNISTNVGKYSTSDAQITSSPLWVNNIQPYQTRVGRVNVKDQQNSQVLTDIESHLWNIDIPLSNCGEERTLPERISKGNTLKGTLAENDTCSEQMKTQYSRFDVPANLFRDVTFHRFDYPIIPPEHFVYYGMEGTEQVNNNRSGTNTRLQAKDSFARK